jgi:hypothetical protein
MALYVTVTRGVTAFDNTVVDADFLNLLGVPQITITGTIDGSSSIELGDGSVTTSKLENSSDENTGVTNPKLAYMPPLTVKGNRTDGATYPQDLTVAQTRSMLSVEADDSTLEHYVDGTTGKIKVSAAGINTTQLANAAVTPPKLDNRPRGNGNGTAGTTVVATTSDLYVGNASTFNLEPSEAGALAYNLVFDAGSQGRTVLVRIKSAGTHTLSFTVGGTATAIRWKGGQVPADVTDQYGQCDLFVFTMFGTVVYAASITSFPA